LRSAIAILLFLTFLLLCTSIERKIVRDLPLSPTSLIVV